MASQSVGNDDQNSRTCSEVSGCAATGGGGKGFMLFGVRVVEGSFIRKSASTNNLAQYEQGQDSNINDVAGGYVSDDVVQRSRHRKRGVAWSEEEHKLFLLGLQKVGKGDWRGISRNFVKTRTPTQVASHAQKYFLRRNSQNRRRRRSSLFDITTDAVLGSTIEDQIHLETPPIMPQENVTKKLEKFPVSPSFPLSIKPLIVPIERSSIENMSLLQLNNSPRPIMPIPILPLPPSSKMAKLDLNKSTTPDQYPPPSSLNLSTTPARLSNKQSPPQPQPPPAQPGRHAAAFEAMPASFNGSGGDSIISVA
ncbi:transcription factor MYB1R1-like [Primulina eburnea]|uniref:transcription factor MYB1R1-like n=1 Tax=Primulina eburnea TaxID=1245227 RepID=UPI003C6CA3A3